MRIAAQSVLLKVQDKLFDPAGVTVLANTAPVVTTSLVQTYDSGNTAAVPSPLTTIVDDSSFIASASISIVLGLTAGDVLAFTQPLGSDIVGNYSSGTLTLTGLGTVAQYQEALQSVTFFATNTLLPSTRTIWFTVTDQQGATSLVSTPLVLTVL